MYLTRLATKCISEENVVKTGQRHLLHYEKDIQSHSWLFLRGGDTFGAQPNTDSKK